jgi:hypothetical protein
VLPSFFSAPTVTLTVGHRIFLWIYSEDLRPRGGRPYSCTSSQ